jgi:hypothetical protein
MCPRVSKADQYLDSSKYFFVSNSVDTFLEFVLHSVAVNLLCDLVVIVPGYRTEMYCVSCEVRTEFMYVM